MIWVFILVGLVVAALIVVGVIASIRAHKKRVAAYVDFADNRGWTFIEKDHAMPGQFEAFGPFGKGNDRYCQWILRGRHDSTPFQVFSYHYETETRDSKGNRQVHHHHHKVAVVQTRVSAPALTIVPENIFHKIGDALGGEDIDFESDEFSRKFWVKCKDRKFAYDVITPKMMEHLLQHRGWRIEWRGQVLMIWKAGSIKLQDTDPMLQTIAGIHKRIPRHVRAEASN